MITILELRQQRAEINAAVQALAKIESSGEELTAEQHAEFISLSAKFSDATAKIDRMETAERFAAAAAKPVDQPASAVISGSPTLPAQPRGPEVKGAKIAMMVRALAAARGDRAGAADIARARGFGDDVSMALNTITPSSGGVLIPENLSRDVIELLRPQSVVRRMGARSLPIENGNMTVSRLKGGAIVDYIGADSDIPETQEEFGDMKLALKKMAAIVPISNDLIRYSGVNPNVDQIVIDDLVNAIGAREDKAFIRDSGEGNTPKGLRFWVRKENLIKPSAETTVETVSKDLSALILFLEQANANMIKPGWIMSPRTRRFLMELRDGVGKKVFPELEESFTLKGYPVGMTTQIPNNLGEFGNESEIYFVDFWDMFTGDAENFEIDYSAEATYKDSAGQVVSAFQRDQTLIRVIAKNDFAPRHVESIAVMTGVNWGFRNGA